MYRIFDARSIAAFVCVVAATFALVAAGGDSPWAAAAAWCALLVTPGLALYLALQRDPDPIEAAACALAASPVLVTVAAVAAMLAGLDALDASRSLMVVAALTAAILLVRRPASWSSVNTRHLALLGGFVLLMCALTGYLPLSDEWWRVRSDAWAHRAYIAEVADFGIPPMDPYFVGFPLQYMWAYHALIHTASEAARIDPFWSMAIVNVQALAGLILSTFLFAATFTRSFSRRMMSAVTVTLGMNAAFWIFLPVKLLRVLTGETRGLEEAARQFSLVRFTYRHTMQFMQIFHNKEFFLDKYMVGTAFGIGLCLMATTWWAATSYLQTGRRLPLIMALVSTLGLLAFHTLVASVMLVGVFGALGILFLTRRFVDGYSLRRSLALAGVMLAAVAVASPYVYSVMHSKDVVGQTSLLLSVERLIGISISIAFVAVLAWFQRGILHARAPAPRFLVAAAAVIAVYAIVVPLPGPNNFDKPPFFIFFPLAVVGAWSLVDLYRRRAALAVTIAVLAFVPANALALASCFNTDAEWSISGDERALASWIQEHTPRDAVLLDKDDHVNFVVLGPRRHLWGRMAFAYQWGYDRLQMSRRYHTWRVVYSSRPMDAVTLATLGSVEDDLYVVVRHDDGDGHVNATARRDYFQTVHRAGSLELLRVDTGRCRDDAASGRFPDVSEEELFSESGL